MDIPHAQSICGPADGRGHGEEVDYRTELRHRRGGHAGPEGCFGGIGCGRCHHRCRLVRLPVGQDEPGLPRSGPEGVLSFVEEGPGPGHGCVPAIRHQSDNSRMLRGGPRSRMARPCHRRGCGQGAQGDPREARDKHNGGGRRIRVDDPGFADALPSDRDRGFRGGLEARQRHTDGHVTEAGAETRA